MTTQQPKLFPTVTAAGYGGNDPSSARAELSEDDQMGVLAELRTKLDGLKRDVAVAAEYRAAALLQGVAEGADDLRREIRRAPGISLAVATLAGVLLAVALTSGRQPEQSWRQTARRYQSAAQDEMDRLLSRARHVADDARGSAAGIYPSVERLADRLSQMDIGGTLAPAIEKGSSLLRTAWLSLTGKS